MKTTSPARQFSNFAEFYPYYLDEHRDARCRRLHFIGSLGVIAIVLLALVTAHYRWLWAVPLCGYGFAWAGHLLYEKNRPATFRHPLYSLAGDWVMFKDICLGRISMR